MKRDILAKFTNGDRQVIPVKGDYRGGYIADLTIPQCRELYRRFDAGLIELSIVAPSGARYTIIDKK